MYPKSCNVHKKDAAPAFPNVFDPFSFFLFVLLEMLLPNSGWD